MMGQGAASGVFKIDCSCSFRHLSSLTLTVKTLLTAYFDWLNEGERKFPKTNVHQDTHRDINMLMENAGTLYALH